MINSRSSRRSSAYADHGRRIAATMRPAAGPGRRADGDRGYSAFNHAGVCPHRTAARRSRIYPDFVPRVSNSRRDNRRQTRLREGAWPNWQPRRRDQAAADAAIDRGHLARMTFGDRSLERELLELFDRQAAMLIVRMRAGGAAAVAPLAHTLKGSASGIGAGRRRARRRSGRACRRRRAANAARPSTAWRKPWTRRAR